MLMVKGATQVTTKCVIGNMTRSIHITTGKSILMSPATSRPFHNINTNTNTNERNHLASLKLSLLTSKLPGGGINGGVTRRNVRTASSAKFFVGGNWKCNGTIESITKLIEDLNAGSVPADVDVVCAPPFVYLSLVSKSLG